MRKVLSAAVAALAVIGATQARAADLKKPVYKAPPPVAAPVPVFSWTGCYVGGHVGGGWGRKDITDPGDNFAPPGASVQIDPSGFIGGGQVGCDLQLSPNWVIGVEGKASWADVRGSTDETPLFSQVNVFLPGQTATATFSERTNLIASVTGRLGYSWDRWLIYGKGGAAWDHDKYGFQGGITQTGNVIAVCIPTTPPIFCPLAFNQSATESRTGWTIGGGFEWAVWNNWSIKLEYQYFDFGTKRVTLVAPDNGPVPADIKQRIETVTFGVNYRFDWGPPPASLSRY
jgi:outer membrane immunogenic protein